MKEEMTQDRMDFLLKKSIWVRRETLKVHKNAPETRIASSLSSLEILVTLYYGNILSFRAENPNWEERDRFIVSKGHGSIPMYPILADLGFFDVKELDRVCKEGSFLGGIPDPIVPGYETVNGSLGHGLGVCCGIALALKRKRSASRIFVLAGDGELYEGANWEAVMFAAHHRLDNIVLIIDSNKVCMLDYCANIIDLAPLSEKFKSFKWLVEEVNGHDIGELHSALIRFKHLDSGFPKVIIANTIKGHGSPKLEGNPLSHVLSLGPDEVDELIKGL